MLNRFKSLLTCSTILLCLSACSTSYASPPTKLDFSQSSSASSTITETTIEDMYKVKPNYDEYLKISKTNIYKKNDIITQDGITYGNIQINKTKSLPEDIHKEDINYFNDGNVIDDNGTLISPTSYIFVTIDVTNNREQEATFSWNASGFFLLDEENNIINKTTSISAWEARYRSGNDGYKGKDYFMQTLQPGESIKATIGYMIEDEWINSPQLYFYFRTPYVKTKFFDNVKAFKINE